MLDEARDRCFFDGSHRTRLVEQERNEGLPLDVFGGRFRGSCLLPARRDGLLGFRILRGLLLRLALLLHNLLLSKRWRTWYRVDHPSYDVADTGSILA